MANKAAMTARSILWRFGIESEGDINVEDIAYGTGLRIDERAIVGAEGRLVRRANSGIAVINSAIRQEGKKRWVIAHELGHFLMHTEDHFARCDQTSFVKWHRHRPEEGEANDFAAELLMPSTLFRDVGRNGPTTLEWICELSKCYRVSRMAAAIRFVELDVAPSAVVYSEDGMIKWHCSSESFPYQYVKRGNAVHPHTGAGEYFSSGQTSGDPECTPCTAWFSDWSLEGNATCLEQCLTMDQYCGVLSLLSMP